MAAAGKGADRRDLARSASRGRRAARSSSASSAGSRRPFQATSTPPSREQRRGELGERREAPDGAGGHRVVGLATGARGELLGAHLDRRGVVDPGGAGREADELALAAHGLDQIDPGGRAARRRARGPESQLQRQHRRSETAAARSATTSPERLSSTCTFQACSGSVTELTEARSTASSSRTLAKAARAAGGELGRGAAHSETSGATTTQRCGSSPSL